MSEIIWVDIPLSSNVARLGWREDPPSLFVAWTKGRISEYDGVDYKLFDELVKSPSVGSAIHERVKGKYSHHYV